MKKIYNYFLAAGVFVMANMGSVFAAENNGACALIQSLMPVIKTLRTLAFIGAAFVLMDWAWGFIKDGKAEKEQLKDKGIGMFVGFFILFGVGMLLQFVGSEGGKEYLGCVVTALQ